MADYLSLDFHFIWFEPGQPSIIRGQNGGKKKS